MNPLPFICATVCRLAKHCVEAGDVVSHYLALLIEEKKLEKQVWTRVYLRIQSRASIFSEKILAGRVSNDVLRIEKPFEHGVFDLHW